MGKEVLLFACLILPVATFFQLTMGVAHSAADEAGLRRLAAQRRVAKCA